MWVAAGCLVVQCCLLVLQLDQSKHLLISQVLSTIPGVCMWQIV